MDATWHAMPRGTQCHMAEPRGPTRAPMWRGGDMRTIFIFFSIFYMVYSKYKRPDYRNSLPLKTAPPYKPDRSLLFSLCGTISLLF